MLSREERREKRRRGKGTRATDLDGLVLEAPPLELDNAVARSNSDIIGKHREMTRVRLERHQAKRKEAKVAVQRRRTIGNKTRERAGAIGVKVKYKRMPQNRAKLIGLDVMSQIVTDYIKSNELATMIGRKLVETGKKKEKSTLREQTRVFFKDYIQRITSYFGNLVDVKLSSQLLMSDLHNVNNQKNEVRSQVFAIRNERNQIAMELQQLREAFLKTRQEYDLKIDLFKKIDSGLRTEAHLVDKVQWKLSKLANGVPMGVQGETRSQLLLSKLRRFNDKLEQHISSVE